jgi:UDP-N-acetyl-D-mannosaminuronic acid transferase (WecB/TagA/CpsF family)
MTQEAPPSSTHRILGIDFFDGSVYDAVKIMRYGGLLVVPAAPALKDLDRNPGYRDALLNADLVLTDSAFMVLIWNRLQSKPVKRLSGLEYLRELLQEPDVRQPGNTFWIMVSRTSAKRNLDWLKGQGITIPEDNVYMAPIYGRDPIADPALVDRLNRLRPQHIIITVGGGTQERLGFYLKRSLAYLSGDQVRIPVWADRFYLGWLFRSFSEPRRFVPRYLDAFKLYPLMRRYRDRLPDLKT